VILSHEQLQRAAAKSGFAIDSHEKVHVLARLGPRMALKGEFPAPDHTHLVSAGSRAGFDLTTCSWWTTRKSRRRTRLAGC
jgi:hypothetical protein